MRLFSRIKQIIKEIYQTVVTNHYLYSFDIFNIKKQTRSKCGSKFSFCTPKWMNLIILWLFIYSHAVPNYFNFSCFLKKLMFSISSFSEF